MTQANSSNRAPRPEWDHYSGILRTFVMWNALLAFVVEVAMLVFVGWWALTLNLPWWGRILVAAGAVGALIALWGSFAAPRARFKVATPAVVAVKVVAFASGALALWGLGFGVAALVYTVVVALNLAVTTYVRRDRKRR